MKKIFTLILTLAMATSLFAQTADDALTLAQEQYEGTARSMAMGGAFTALGGDLGAVAINPASSGVFRCSQLTFSPSITTSRSSVDYLGNSIKTSLPALTMSNLAAVFTFDTGRYNGLLNYNFSFAYNRKNSFRGKMSARGTTSNTSMLSAIAAGLEGIDWQDIDLEKTSNPYATSSASWPGILAWNAYALAPLSVLGGQYSDVNDSYIASTENYDEASNELRIGGSLNQRFNRKTYGSTDEFALNFGGNINDFLYFGVNLNLHSVNRTVEEYYEEVAQNSNDFQDGFVSMDNSYWLRTTGSGANFKFGVIVTPFGGLRLGATVTTPTWYTLTDEWDYTMNTAFNNGNTYTEYSPTGSWSYRLTTPMRWSVGAAYTFWDRGLVSVDYEKVNYASTLLKLEEGGYGNFGQENLYMQQNFSNASILRAGAELRLSQLLSLRGGYQHYSPAEKGASAINVYSAGLGFNISQTFSIDLAWNRTSTTAETFQLYDDYSTAVSAPRGVNSNGLSRVVCTLGVKF